MARRPRRRLIPYGPQFGVGADGKPTITSNDPISRAVTQKPLGSPEVIRRQRLLRAHGYQVVVDGRWGPMSRRFWKHYQQTRKVAVGPKPKPRVPPTPAGLVARDVIEGRNRASVKKAQAVEATRIANENAQARAAAIRKLAAGANAFVAQKQPPIAARRDRVAAAATTLKPAPGRNPERPTDGFAAERAQGVRQEQQRILTANRIQARKAWSKPSAEWTAHDVWLLTSNEATRKLDVTNPQHVRRLQHWLGAKGHKVPLSGRYDRTTDEALKAFARKAQKREAVAVATDFVDKTFRSGILAPGQPGLPVYGGKIPSRTELISLLSDGTFSSHLLFTTLWQRAAMPNARYLLWTNEVLGKLERDLFGPFATPGFLNPSVTERASRVAFAATALGSTPKAETENDTFVPQVLALAQSKTAFEFQQKATAIARADEKAYKAAQAIRAMTEGSSFWGKAFDALSWPSDKTFEYGTTATILFKNALRGAGSGGRGSATVEQAHAAALEEQEFLKKEHPWRYMGITVLLDPLNVAPGLGTMRLGGRAATEGLHRAGLALSRKGTLVAEDSLYRLDSLALKGIGQALQAPQSFRLGVGADWAAAKSGLDASESVLGKTWRTGKRLGRLKDETHQIALSKARVVLRRGFRKPKQHPLSLADRDLYTDVDFYTFDGAFGEQLDASAETMRYYLRKHAPTFVQALINDGISLAGNDAREVETMVGGMIVGRLGAEAQHTAVEMTARQARSETYEALLAKYADLTLDELDQLPGAEAAIRPMDQSDPKVLHEKILKQIAFAQAQREYDRVIRDAAFYAAGGADIGISKRVDNIASRALDRLITVLHADVQELLEEAAEQRIAAAVAKGMDEAEARATLGLFDEAGIHHGSSSPVQEWLKEQARNVFDDTIKVSNGRFGRAYTKEERDELIDLEVRQRMRQLTYHKARRGIDGRPVEDSQVDALLEQHVDSIEGHWLEVTDELDRDSPLVKRWKYAASSYDPPPVGSWIDTRSVVEVPRVYARHLTPAHTGLDVWDPETAAAARAAATERGTVPETTPDGKPQPVGRRNRSQVPFALNRADLSDVVVGRPGEAGDALMRRAGVLPFQKAGELVRGFASLNADGDIVRIDFLTFDNKAKKWVTRDFNPQGWGEAAYQAIQSSFSANAADGRSVLGAITDIDAQTFSRVDDELQRLVAASMGTPGLGKFDFESRPFARGYRGQDEPLVEGTAEIEDYFNAIENRAEHLQAAYDSVLPRILMREGAIWQAMAEAQAGWLKTLYTGMSAWLDVWTTLTLPFRPAFAIRNVIDNTVKMLVAGVRDPRAFFVGGEKPGSVFDIDLRAIRHILSVGHRYDQNPAIRYFDEIVQEVWDLGGDALSKVFHTHGVPVPKEAIEGMRYSQIIDTPSIRRYQLVAKGDELRDPNSVLWGYYKDRIWELAADKPETFAKRSIYRDTYYKAIRDGATPVDAFHEAMTKVDHVLFDYSKLSTLEHNLKFIFPFAFYWRKTTVFWGTQVLNKPYLAADWDKFEDARNQAHADQPEWMRRYFDASWINNVVARVPGLSWLAPGLADFTTQFDPANFFSFTPLYRTFKSENPNLPPDKAGWRFISGLADGINDLGLSFNPIVRKPLEMAGVFNFRAWQTMFPQTALVDAFTTVHLKEMFPNGFNVEEALLDPLFKVMLDTSPSEVNDRYKNELVQKEIAAQVARGEKPSRARATRKVEQFALAQWTVAYFAGVFTRNNDPGEHALYVMADELRKKEIDFLDMSKQDQKAYALFKRRGWSARAFDRYQQAYPAIQAYYALGDYQKSEEFKQKHPEILPYVAPGPSSRPLTSKKAIRHVALQVDTVASMQLFDWAKGARINPDLVETTRTALVTPELEKYWARNDTKKEHREKMLRGEFWRYFQGVQDAYFAIPDTDYDARDEFARDNPILSAGWGMNNTPYDDLRSVEGQFLSDLREAYFEYADRDDWDGANAFLKAHPFVFDGTSAEGRVWNGMLLPDDPQKARDFRKAYPGLQRYFALQKTNKNQAYRWLRSGDPLARLALAYFGKYPSGTRSQHSKDYLKVKSLLDWFFNQLAANGAFRGHFSKWEWVFKSNDPAAKQLRWYFQKYGKKGGRSQKARDYLAAKKHLDHYFSLVNAGRKDDAREWLQGGSKGAAMVLAYFKKYSKANQFQRKYSKRVRAQNPELDQRLKFWSIYFSLPDDQKPGFVHRAAERYGIFVYGIHGDEQRAEAEKRYLRWAKGTRMSEKAAAYLRIKPMLDFYFKLDSGDRLVFKRLNPEVGDYLAKYSDTDFTDNKALNKLIATYVRLPDGSPDRSQFLRDHPEVQDYFDETRPADSAIRNLLEVYFDIQDPQERQDFSLQHPEISAYFEARREERNNQQAELAAFDDTDPRLEEARDDAYRQIVLAGEAKRMQLRLQGATGRSPKTIETRRDRRTEAIPGR